MKTIVKLTDVDVDGCGTNIEALIEVEGNKVTYETVERVNKAIQAFKSQNEDDWDTDGCLNAASNQFESEGYKVTYIIPFVDIEF